uniref:Uncharacterized protein n=1 Tax=Haptolina ericina TaxID=156174 RepID=A0A7S3F2I3_9EUKA|mmetsp:Transcript_49350/g.110995  ORF Transcript_49350/g.110995 Transcript_49350/m.110995 type:complete len:495 (+) Transcript_49350:13-1497(+)
MVLPTSLSSPTLLAPVPKRSPPRVAPGVRHGRSSARLLPSVSRKQTSAPELLEQYFQLCGVPHTRQQLTLLTSLTGTATDIVIAWFDQRIEEEVAERARARVASRRIPLNSLTESSLVDMVAAGHMLDEAGLARLRAAAAREEAFAKKEAEIRMALEAAEKERAAKRFAEAQARGEERAKAKAKARAAAAMAAAAAAAAAEERAFRRSREEREAQQVVVKVEEGLCLEGWEISRLRASAALDQVRYAKEALSAHAKAIQRGALNTGGATLNGRNAKTVQLENEIKEVEAEAGRLERDGLNSQASRTRHCLCNQSHCGAFPIAASRTTVSIPSCTPFLHTLPSFLPSFTPFLKRPGGRRTYIAHITPVRTQVPCARCVLPMCVRLAQVAFQAKLELEAAELAKLKAHVAAVEAEVHDEWLSAGPQPVDPDVLLRIEVLQTAAGLGSTTTYLKDERSEGHSGSVKEKQTSAEEREAPAPSAHEHQDGVCDTLPPQP